MKNRYRVKLNNERIVGPFSVDQIGELYIKGHIDESVSCQKFPSGEWKTLDQFKDISNLIADIMSDKVSLDDIKKRSSDSTIVKMSIPSKKKLEEVEEEPTLEEEVSIEEPAAPKEDLKEFSFGTEDEKIDIDYNELEKKYESKSKEEAKKAKLEEKPKEPERNVEKTVVRKSPIQEVEKTKIVNPQVLEDLQEDKPEENAVEEKMIKKAEEVIEKEDTLDTNEATEFINVKELLPDIKKKTEEAEKEIKQLAKSKKVKVDKEEDEDEEEEEEPSKSKKARPLILVAIIGLIYYLMDEGEPKKVVVAPKKVTLTFPVQNEYLNEGQAAKDFQEGKQLYSQQTYLSKALATVKFQNSLKNQFDKNPALGYLIMAYAELLPNAKNVQSATVVLNKLVRLSQLKIYNDINIAIGVALYYLNSGKYYTARKTIENYIRVTKKPSLKMFSIYLQATTRVGDFEQAKKLYDTLTKASSKMPIEGYIAVAEYHKKNQNHDQALEIINQGLKKFSKSVRLLLKKADEDFRLADLDSYKKTLTLIEKLNYESCPEYYGKYLEHLGMVSAMQGKTQQATTFFKKALKYHDSMELRSKLATLEVGGGDAAEQLIRESKIIALMEKAKEFRKLYQWDKAFAKAIEAADLDERYIPAHLLLSDIQIERGYFESAINTLKRLKSNFAADFSVSIYLINAYIKSYRMNDALTEINYISQDVRIRDSYEYASILAKYFFEKNLYKSAVDWLKESIKLNPLNDEDYYRLSLIYKKANKFPNAKKYLLEAINLNPEETKYKITYSQILREQDGFDVAIGYLRDEIKNTRNKTLVLSEIAANYYRSGQIKDFEDTYKEVLNMNLKDESFFRFLVRASSLNDDTEKVIEYSNELIKIKPGDMDTRITLAEAFLGKRQFDNALTQLEEIKSRMSNFPKVNFFLSKTYFLKGDLQKALELAEEEIKANPRIPEGYLMKGKVFFKNKEYSDAIKTFEKTLSIDPKNVDALIELAIIRKQQNKFDQARELLLRAMRLDKNNPLIHKELGYVFKGIGQSVMATEYFNTYLQLLPSAGDADQIKAVIRQLK